MHYSHLNERMQFTMKMTCCLFIYMERELEKTLATLMKNYLVKITIAIKK